MNDKSVVIITGAAGEIGNAVALRFSKSGFIPVLVDIDADKLQALSEAVKGFVEEHMIVSGDLQNPVFLKKIVDDTFQKYGRVDVLVNNAAWRSIGTMRTISLEDWEKAIRINLTAPAFLAKYTVEAMEKHKLSGVIINVSSVMARRAGGYAPAYTVCKGAIESLTYELAVLYGPQGIRVVAINPGNVDSDMSRDYVDEHGDNISQELAREMNNNTPLMRAALPAEIANAVFWVASSEASFITGTTLEVDGGFSKNFNSYTIKKRLNSSEF